MACRDPQDDYPDYGPYNREIDKLTNLLCQLCTVFEREGTSRFFENIPGLLSWWGEHKLADAKRRKREQDELDIKSKIAYAKAKLTDEEKELLHIRD